MYIDLVLKYVRVYYMHIYTHILSINNMYTCIWYVY